MSKVSSRLPRLSFDRLDWGLVALVLQDGSYDVGDQDDIGGNNGSYGGVRRVV